MGVYAILMGGSRYTCALFFFLRLLVVFFFAMLSWPLLFVCETASVCFCGFMGPGKVRICTFVSLCLEFFCFIQDILLGSCFFLVEVYFSHFTKDADRVERGHLFLTDAKTNPPAHLSNDLISPKPDSTLSQAIRIAK
jgi:hypothetical protein